MFTDKHTQTDRQTDAGSTGICNGLIVWLCSSAVECSHDKRETLGSSPGRSMFFFLACDIWWLSVGPCSGCEQQRDCLVGSSMVPSRFGDESFKAGGNCNGLIVWLGSSAVRVLAQ